MSIIFSKHSMDRVKRIWYLSPMRAAKVQASLHIRAVSAEPSLLAHTSRESRGTFRQKARCLAALNSWACAVKICHDGMLEDTNSLDAARIIVVCQHTAVLTISRKVLWKVTFWPVSHCLQMVTFSVVVFEPPHDKTNKVACAPSEDSDQPRHRPSLIRVFACTQWKAKDPSFVHADSDNSDQTGRMPRLIGVFAGCTCYFVGFVMRRLISFFTFFVHYMFGFVFNAFIGRAITKYNLEQMNSVEQFFLAHLSREAHKVSL